MAEGWVKLWRKANDCAALQQFDARGVWDWMLGQAAHQPTKVNWRGATLTLDRGQLAISVRGLARQGEISRKRMRIIMDRFQADGMIQQQPIWGTVKGPGKGPVGLLLSICHYDEYQIAEEWWGPAEGPGKGPPGAHQGPIEQESKNLNSESVLKDTTLSESPAPNGAGHTQERMSYRFTEFWACWDIAGTKKDRAAAERRYIATIKSKRATHEELCAGVRRYMAWCRRERQEVRFIKAPDVWLNKGCWTDEFAGPAATAAARRDPFIL